VNEQAHQFATHTARIDLLTQQVAHWKAAATATHHDRKVCYTKEGGGGKEVKKEV